MGNSSLSVHAAPAQSRRMTRKPWRRRCSSLGFEVSKGIDLDRAQTELLIREFTKKLPGADVALFFYAGHGHAGQPPELPDARRRQLTDETRPAFRGDGPQSGAQPDGARTAGESGVPRRLPRQPAGRRQLARSMGSTRSSRDRARPRPGRRAGRQLHRFRHPARQRRARRRGQPQPVHGGAAETHRNAGPQPLGHDDPGAQRREDHDQRAAGAEGKLVADQQLLLPARVDRGLGDRLGRAAGSAEHHR